MPGPYTAPSSENLKVCPSIALTAGWDLCRRDRRCRSPREGHLKDRQFPHAAELIMLISAAPPVRTRRSLGERATGGGVIIVFSLLVSADPGWGRGRLGDGAGHQSGLRRSWGGKDFERGPGGTGEEDSGRGSDVECLFSSAPCPWRLVFVACSRWSSPDSPVASV